MWSFGIGAIALLSWVSCTFCQADIRLPPYIITGPEKSKIFRSDDTVTLNCKGNGVPAVIYEWKKNGVGLNLNAPNIKVEAEGVITIHPATLFDEGYYQCFARNQYGAALSTMSHILRANLESSSGTASILPKAVREGEPFHLQAEPRKSFPKPTYGWEMALDTVDKNPTQLIPSKRVQVADNGDLYFAYALPEDEIGGKIYKCTTYNQYLDFKAGGCYTKLTIERVSGGAVPFAPTLAFSTEPMTVAVVGGSATLRCFFSGNAEPTLSWKGPKNTLPIGRYKLDKHNSELTITNIEQGDEGDYKCTASNSRGNAEHTLQIKVEAIPTFKAFGDGPRNINVTDGDSVTFNCSAAALPEAKIVWLQDGVELNVDNLPRRFSISSDKKRLTVKDVCRNCGDREKFTDLTVIQCNASNVHGYAFGSGYLNVLDRTKVIPASPLEVHVGIYEERRFDFECKAVSDPSTPASVRWYKRENNDEFSVVHEDPPTVTINDGTLSISLSPNGTDSSKGWTKYEGEYHCTASNGYSTATRIVTIDVAFPPNPQVAAAMSNLWWVFLLIALILIILILILCCCIYLNRNKGDKYDVDEKERKNGNDPEKELLDGDFKDYKRPEGQTLKGSRGSLGSSVKLNSDEEASLNEYGDDPGKFTEDGSFVGAYTAGGTVDRKKGRAQ